jgi:ribonuclease Z
MKFEVTILGCNSALPTSNRNPSAQILNIFERFFLVDCGEGTQLQLRRYKFRIQKINHIFISHLHGDHYFGLIGLLSSLHLLGRKDPLHLYAHEQLKQIIELQLKASDTKLNFELLFHSLEYDDSKVIYEDKTITVQTIPLKHRIPCCGFLFKEKPKERILVKERLQAFNVPLHQYHAIKAGEDYIDQNNQVVLNALLTRDPSPCRSYAYCSDTAYDETIVKHIEQVDLLYHEATFMQQMQARAAQTFHSTTQQAGTIAKKAQVKKLIIGHYSSRYTDLDPLLKETQTVFENTELGVEGRTYQVG